MKILIDMNLSPAWVDVFAADSLEAIHWSSVGDVGATDRAIMAWASTHGYIVFTHDLDFGALLAATKASCPSVIQVRSQDTFPEHLKTIVIPAIKRFRSSLESGALITVDEARSRVRILPFQ